MCFRNHDLTCNCKASARGTNINLGTLNVDITAVNDAPVITTTNLNSAENQTAVGTVVATDVDLPPDTLTWSLTGSGADDGLFSINSSSGALTFATAPDFETPGDTDGDNVYDIEVQVFDGTANTIKTISVTVTDVNEAPVITSDGGGMTAGLSVAEGSTAITTITATDEDLPADTLAFSIIGGADSSQFSINGTTGELAFTTAKNFEMPTDADGTYEVQVTVNDGNGGMDVQTISIAVTDVNDVPVANADSFMTDSGVTFVMASPGLLANDVDEDGDPLTAVFVAGPANGTLLLAADGSFSYSPFGIFVGTDSITYAPPMEPPRPVPRS